MMKKNSIILTITLFSFCSLYSLTPYELDKYLVKLTEVSNQIIEFKKPEKAINQNLINEKIYNNFKKIWSKLPNDNQKELLERYDFALALFLDSENKDFFLNEMENISQNLNTALKKIKLQQDPIDIAIGFFNEVFQTNVKINNFQNRSVESDAEKAAWCLCRNAPFHSRLLYLNELIKDIISHYGKDKAIIYTSLGSGGFLQDYLTIKTLFAIGYKEIVINLIEPILFLEHQILEQHIASAKQANALIDRLKNSLFEDQKITIHTFKNVDEYIRQGNKNETIITMVDTSQQYIGAREMLDWSKDFLRDVKSIFITDHADRIFIKKTRFYSLNIYFSIAFKQLGINSIELKKNNTGSPVIVKSPLMYELNNAATYKWIPIMDNGTIQWRIEEKIEEKVNSPKPSF